ncbi:MAG: hypothetical protein PUJ60_04095 [bacterium]|nr:hypothetical protein [bacterium]MDY4108300.1 hypothetical protein [Bacilli bacterium]
MYKKWEYKNISELSLKKEIIDKLNEKEVFLIKDLCSLRRRVLKEYGFSNDEINDIIITLQLVGLDLNKKKK